MRVLVTGATGFIGRQAVSALLRAGHSVACTARNITRAVPADWIQSDLLAEGEPERVVQSSGANSILHMAWTTEHGKYWTDPANTTWTAASINLVSAALKHGVKRFVGVGTCFEYDWPVDDDCNETSTPIVQHFPYDAAKDDFHRALAGLSNSQGLEYAWGRIFHLYGPGENPSRLVASIARSIQAGHEAKCSTGRMLCDFMDVRDAGRALAELAVSNVTGPVNIASGDRRTVAQIAHELGDLAGTPHLIKIGALPDRQNEPARITASIERLRNEVGFKNEFTLRDGLQQILSSVK